VMGRGLVGKRYGRLAVLMSLGRGGDGSTLYHCRCDCGEYVAELAHDRVISCGDCAHATAVASVISDTLREGAARCETPPAPMPAPAPAPPTPIPDPKPAPTPEPLHVPRVTRPVRTRRDPEERTPNVDDDPDGFLTWRLALIGRISRQVMREIEGDEREDLEELQLGGAA